MRRILTKSKINERIPINKSVGVQLSKKQTKAKQHYIDYLRWQYEFRHKFQYIFPNTYNTQQEKHKQFEKINLYGNEHTLIGQTNSLENSQMVMAALEEFKPKICLLGGMNRFDLKEMKYGYNIYTQKPQIFNKDTDLIAKNRMLKFFEEDFKESTLYFQLPDDKVIYRNDPQNKKCHMENQLSAANLYTQAPDRFLMFSKPDINLLFEDLVLRLDVNQLREIFNHVISYIYEQSDQQNWEPEYQNDKLFQYIRSAAKQLYSDVLFEKQVLYSASIFKKSARLFKKAGMVIDQELLQSTKKAVYENILPEYDMIFRQFLDQNSQNKYEQLNQERLKKASRFFKDDIDRELIKQQLQDFNQKYDFSSESTYYENIQQKSYVNPEEIIEKYAILGYLIDNYHRNFLEQGINPFKITIFKDVLGDYSVEDIMDIYNKVRQEHFTEIHQLQNHIIKKMHNSSVQGRYYLESFDEQVNKIQNKQKDVQFKFAIGQKSKLKRLHMIVETLFSQMTQIIQRRQKEGIEQTEQMEAVKSILSGDVTEEGLNQFNQLLMEANMELGGIMKFPQKFDRYLGYLTNVQKHQLIGKIDKKIAVLEKYSQTLYENQQNGAKLIVGNSIFQEKLEMDVNPLQQQPEDNDEDSSDDEQNDNEKFDPKKLDSNNSVFFALGEGQVPFDIQDKSIEELMEMGFQEIGNQGGVQYDQEGNIVEGDDDKNEMDQEHKQEIQNMLKGLLKDEKRENENSEK